MSDLNPYEPPHESSSSPGESRRRGAIPQPLVRIGVGLFGAFFVAPALYVVIVTFTGEHRLAELTLLPAMIGGGIGVAWASFARVILLRIIAWSAAGLGAGHVLEAIVSGGLGVGTVITTSGIVLGVVGAVFGLRAQPQ